VIPFDTQPPDGRRPATNTLPTSELLIRIVRDMADDHMSYRRIDRRHRPACLRIIIMLC